jgi:hypothetical protein
MTIFSGIVIACWLIAQIVTTTELNFTYKSQLKLQTGADDLEDNTTILIPKEQLMIGHSIVTLNEDVVAQKNVRQYLSGVYLQT